MVRIIDTSSDFLLLFDHGLFNLDRWKTYMDRWIPGAKELCLGDLQDCIQAGCFWEQDYLPILNAVYSCEAKREETIRVFHAVMEHIDERILTAFDKSVDVDVVLYIGLGNGAGWVTNINEKAVVLLGIEKIIELDWGNENDMTGLIIHELGHVFQAQYGSLSIDPKSNREEFLWQLFTEGAAMVFEQEVVGNPNYFHQDKNGWKQWCDAHFEHIKQSFDRDLDPMSLGNQRYFGDWVSFEGHPDVGYYLGACFVRFLLQSDVFESIIRYEIERVQFEFNKFIVA